MLRTRASTLAWSLRERFPPRAPRPEHVAALETVAPNRRAGVTLLNYLGDEGEQRVLLVQRSMRVRHPGQIGFPGGGFNPSEDRHLFDTARRELAEEVTVETPAHRPVFLGSLPPMAVSVSGFVVLPVVAVLVNRACPSGYPGLAAVAASSVFASSGIARSMASPPPRSGVAAPAATAASPLPVGVARHGLAYPLQTHGHHCSGLVYASETSASHHHLHLGTPARRSLSTADALIDQGPVARSPSFRVGDPGELSGLYDVAVRDLLRTYRPAQGVLEAETGIVKSGPTFLVPPNCKVGVDADGDTVDVAAALTSPLRVWGLSARILAAFLGLPHPEPSHL